MQRERSDLARGSCGRKTDNYIPWIFLRLRYRIVQISHVYVITARLNGGV